MSLTEGGRQAVEMTAWHGRNAVSDGKGGGSFASRHLEGHAAGQGPAERRLAPRRGRRARGIGPCRRRRGRSPRARRRTPPRNGAVTRCRSGRGCPTRKSRRRASGGRSPSRSITGSGQPTMRIVSISGDRTGSGTGRGTGRGTETGPGMADIATPARMCVKSTSARRASATGTAPLWRRRLAADLAVDRPMSWLRRRRCTAMLPGSLTRPNSTGHLDGPPRPPGHGRGRRRRVLSRPAAWAWAQV